MIFKISVIFFVNLASIFLSHIKIINDFQNILIKSNENIIISTKEIIETIDAY